MALVSFNQVAKSYFPFQTNKSASNSLTRWLRRCPELHRELSELGLKARQRFFTPHMVNRIYYHLGEP